MARVFGRNVENISEKAKKQKKIEFFCEKKKIKNVDRCAPTPKTRTIKGARSFVDTVMWPYLRTLDPSADMDFLGWIVAACSIGSTISTPIYGYWNQKTMSVRYPAITGFLIASLGQLWYALLHLFPTHAKWVMLVARLFTGLGVGNISVIRVYLATASTEDDRMRAISFGTAGFVSGISFGPVISACFTPLGEQGVYIFSAILINMYTIVAFLMFFVSLAVCLLIYFCFEESYPGIVDEAEKTRDNIVVPKFDKLAAAICTYLFIIVNINAANIEVMSTPMTVVLYDWRDADAILYNGIILFLCCVVSVTFNITLGTTRLGNVDKRIQMLLGTSIFLLYNLFMFPWPMIYQGPLNFIHQNETTINTGGCLPEYDWCSYTTRISLPLYILCNVVFFGVAFPFMQTPSAALYSEVLGPRKQGTMQGVFSMVGCVAPVIQSITSTSLFQHTGFRYIILFQTTILLVGAALIFGFYRRLVPLKIVRNVNNVGKL